MRVALGLVLLALLFLPASSFAQGVVIQPKIALGTINGVTKPISNPTITVCAANASGLPCSPALASTVFKDQALTQSQTNPFTGDANGNYNFAIAAGTYTVTETAAGFTGYSYQLTVTCPLAGACTFTGTRTFTGTLALNPGPLTLASAASAARTATFPDNTGTVAELNLVQTWPALQSFSTVQGVNFIANQGANCTNGELALSAGWGTTASVGSVKGIGSQTCEWTITSSGTGQAANPTVTDTLTNPLLTATLCTMDMHGGTGSFTMIDNTTLSSTAPVFTFNGTPAAGSTYIVARRCGP